MKPIFSNGPRNPHSLSPGLLPVLAFQRLLRVHPEERKLLAWVTLIQMVISASSILVNNVAQTAFIKRYGVEALPTVFLTEALLTMGLTLFLGLLMTRLRNLRVFTGLLIFYGLSVAGIRLLIPTGADWIYPVLYIVKSQAVGILPILYWDILGDLFTTQQSKRLYTLIVAGGILGTMAVSMATARIAAWVGVDNILWIFTFGMGLAALLNEMTEQVIGHPLQYRKAGGSKREKEGVVQTARKVAAEARRSDLLVYLVLLMAIPNMILPVLDYQFNVLVDQYFATEGGTLRFFGMFRGVSNLAIFSALLLSSRLITRWGVSTSLLFHPANYLLSFVGFFLRFDLFTGIYARFSTEMLKTALNNPARAVLYNFFPDHLRGPIRLVLRGGVVRGADFAGSGFLALVRGLVEPRFLSLVAAPLALVWMMVAVRLKKTYPNILIRALEQRQIDWHQVETLQIESLVNNPAAAEVLRRHLQQDTGPTAVVRAALMKRAGVGSWQKLLVGALKDKSLPVQRQLIELLTPETARPAMEDFYRLAVGADPDLLEMYLPALIRLDPAGAPDFCKRYLSHPDPRIRAQALGGVCIGCEPGLVLLARNQVSQWLSGDAAQQMLAYHVMAAGGLSVYAAPLRNLWDGQGEPQLRALALEGLWRMGDPCALDLARNAYREPGAVVMESALAVLSAAGWTVDRRKASSPATAVLPGWTDRMIRLRSVPMFRGVTQRELIQAADAFSEMRCFIDETLMMQGEAATRVFVLLSGSVMLQDLDAGRNRGFSEPVRPNDGFGEAAVIEGISQPYAAFATAGTVLLVAGAESFRRMIKEIPMVAINLCSIYSKKIQNYHEWIQKSVHTR